MMPPSWVPPLYLALLVVFFVPVLSAIRGPLPPPCDSLIYCHGPLLQTVQLAEIYEDSKYFVDMSMKNSPSVTLQHFYKLMNETDQEPTKEQIREFVDMNFAEPGTEFVTWDPPDWEQDPEFLKKIVDPSLEQWGRDLNALWKQLGRKTSNRVQISPEKYSLIYMPHPVIVPGGRFREVYYWDSYWTMEGLLLSGMRETAKGMLLNFVESVRKEGLVPNGGRVYYTRRSQPPYLISMVKLYVDYTGDIAFVRANIDLLEKEFQFWERDRSTAIRDLAGRVHKVTRYDVKVGEPRPESYKEDYKLALNLTTEEEKERLYVELKSGAESGWDYSTRWFLKGDSNQGGLSDLNVTSIAPVDLNSLLCRNAKILGDFYQLLGNVNKSAFYEDLASVKNQTLADLFWDEEDGIWYDVNIHTKKKRKFFYLSNTHPMWSGCYGLEGKREDTVKKVINYLKKTKVVDYISGVPTSLNESGQQWDYPNAWAPLQHIVIMGLYNSKLLNPDAEPLAFDLAEKWVQTNYRGYEDTNSMYEKYDVNVVGVAGGGGEYNVQLGFGWSNGVAMKLLDTFGDRLTPAVVAGSNRNAGSFSVALLFPILLLIVGSRRRVL